MGRGSLSFILFIFSTTRLDRRVNVSWVYYELVCISFRTRKKNSTNSFACNSIDQEHSIQLKSLVVVVIRGIWDMGCKAEKGGCEGDYYSSVIKVAFCVTTTDRNKLFRITAALCLCVKIFYLFKMKRKVLININSSPCR